MALISSPSLFYIRRPHITALNILSYSEGRRTSWLADLCPRVRCEPSTSESSVMRDRVLNAFCRGADVIDTFMMSLAHVLQQLFSSASLTQ